MNRTLINNSDVCEQCGAEIRKDLFVIDNRFERDILMLLIYISWIFLNAVWFSAVDKFIIRGIVKEDPMKIGSFMSTYDLVISGIDLLLIVVILSLLKNNLTKRFFIVFLVVRIVLFAIGRI
jgi:hypothetical protein